MSPAAKSAARDFGALAVVGLVLGVFMAVGLAVGSITLLGLVGWFTGGAQ